ncbi:MAG: hypothetical protein DRP85_03845 [Candidatus Makaraimicrobium thalassicum]|nr:MAG: hypothetical protein DRP85_03845 [Candidatus Omnitrophota bacterium]
MKRKKDAREQSQLNVKRTAARQGLGKHSKIKTGRDRKSSPAKTIEVEAISVEDAIRKALNMLNAKEQEVSIEVLKEENKGLFGMEGAELAKIKVTLELRK